MKYTEQELDRILAPPEFRKIVQPSKISYVDKWQKEGIELRPGGEIVQFVFRSDTRMYVDLSELGSTVLKSLFAKNKFQKEPEKPEKQDNNLPGKSKDTSIVLSEELTYLMTQKIAAMSFVERLLYFQKTDSQYIEERQGPGGKKIHYVKGHYLHQVLNLVSCFAWNSYIDDKKETDSECIVFGHITIWDLGKEITKSAVGQADKKKGVSVGDTFKAANTDMEKKAASKFGLAMDVYRGDYD